MTFSATLSTVIPIVFGDRKMTMGKYVNTASTTGGNIDTGLKICERIILQPSAGTVIANNPVVNETLPVAGNAITIVTSAGEDGDWIAFGTDA
jgi:hypothetical protein